LAAIRGTELELPGASPEVSTNVSLQISLPRAQPTPSSTASTARARWSGHLGNTAIRLGSVLTLLALWCIGAALLPSNIMPPPNTVARVLWGEMTSGGIWKDVLITLDRIALAFTLAMTAALILGFAMGLSKTAERFFEIWIIGGITVPSLVLILTIYMIVGLNDRAAILGAALPVVPILTINIWEGVKNIDHKLIGMAKAYHAGQARIVVSVIGPQVAPVLLASARFGLGLIWKMVLFVELLGRSDGIGYKIEFYYQMFNMNEVLAHALIFVVIMLFLEIVVLGSLERRLFRWRPAPLRL
jgi:NitT/TauT family transport system permease protein